MAVRIIAAFIAFLVTFCAFAQTGPGTVPGTRSTIAAPVKITTGLTYQVLLATNSARASITIQNNNATDSCEIIVGGPWAAADTTATARTINGVSMTALQASIVLTAGLSYTRYYPLIPSDQILGTCANTGDSIYVDTQ